MAIDRIEIDANNTQVFAKLAYLVDRPDFLEDIFELRRRWGFMELVDYSSWDNILDSVVSRLTKAQKDKFKKMRDDSEKELQEKKNEVAILVRKREYPKVIEILSAIDKLQRTWPRTGLQKDAEDLAYKYNQHRLVFITVLTAMACGVVKEDDYMTCDARVEIPFVGFNMSSLLSAQKPEILFSISPQTTWPELYKLYQAQKKELVDKYEEYVSEAKIPVPVKLRDIREIRELYWKLERTAVTTTKRESKYDKVLGTDSTHNEKRQALYRYRKALRAKERHPFYFATLY